TTRELRIFLQDKVPDYMVPSVFVSLDTLPLTPNGKVDRQAFPEPDLRPELRESFVAPRNPREEVLANIWSKLLGIEQVGIHDNFFELGGHSLLALRLFAEIERQFKKRLSLSSLYRSATIEHLAGLVSQRNFLTPRTCLVPMQPKGARCPFFSVHDISGDVVCYMNLARLVGKDQPFYA